MARIEQPDFHPEKSVHRNVAFTAVDGSTLLQQGTVVDMSRDGLHFHTACPPRIGSVIELEVEPRADGADARPLIVRGHVTSVDPVPNRTYSVGVRLRYQLGTPQPVTGTIREEPARTNRPGYAHAAAVAWQRPSARHVGWRTWAYASGIVIVLVVLLMASLAVDSGWDLAMFQGGDRLASEARPVAEKPAPVASSSSNSGGGGKKDSFAATAVPATEQPLAESKESELAALLSAAEAVAERYESRNGKNASGKAQHASRNRKAMEEALEAAAPSNPESPGAVDAPSTTLADLQTTVRPVLSPFASAPAQPASREGFETTKPIEPFMADGVHLLVDHAAHALTVYRDGKPVTKYAVSLGTDGSTPTGVFTIHNKLRNPDWYNKGESVPHGDPRNPLGASWMGFAKDGKPLSVGIHPTTKVAALGQPDGPGCVRMNPDDAEALFRLCPLGATVTVR